MDFVKIQEYLTELYRSATIRMHQRVAERFVGVKMRNLFKQRIVVEHQVLVKIMLDPEAITTRVTLSAITQNALKTK